jgi:NADPH2:quinone reductase
MGNSGPAEPGRLFNRNDAVEQGLPLVGTRLRAKTGPAIVIDSIGGEVLSEALSTLAVGGSLTTLGYSANRKTRIDVTHLIWKRASIKSFSLFGQPQSLWDEAWTVIRSLIDSEAIKPIVAKTFPLAEAADALKYIVEKRPFGKVALTI